MIAAGLAPPLAAVVGAGFTHAGGRARLHDGRLVLRLPARHAAAPSRCARLYRSAGNFTDVYRMPLADLEREWRAFLAQQPLTPARARPRERGLPPPRHLQAGLRARARGARRRGARHRARRPGPRASRCSRRPAATIPPSRPTSSRSPRREALAGERARALARLGRLEVDGEVTAAAARPGGLAGGRDRLLRRRLRQRRGRAGPRRRAGRRPRPTAGRRWRSSAASPIASARDTLGRALFGDELGRAGADPVLTFFFIQEYARLLPTDALGPYLVGRQLLGRDPARALPYLSRACGDETPPSTLRPLPVEFLRECRRMTADAAYRTGDFGRARAALERLAADASGEADRLRALDMRARVDWASERRTGAAGVGVGARETPSSARRHWTGRPAHAQNGRRCDAASVSSSLAVRWCSSPRPRAPSRRSRRPPRPPAAGVPGAPPLQELPPTHPRRLDARRTLAPEPAPAPPPLALDQRSTPAPSRTRAPSPSTASSGSGARSASCSRRPRSSW